jgi:electron transport complex protein RnfC
MRMFTFKRGVHPRETLGGKSITGKMPVADAAPPETVAIALSQHVGAPCNSLVKAGQRVLMGQKIGEPAGVMGAPVHSSVSGIVKGIQSRAMTSGARGDCVVIQNDGLDERDTSLKIFSDPLSADRDELRHAIREAGLVGLGGAAFPLEIKLSPAPDKRIDYVILNGAECEPYLTGDHRMMVEHPEKVVDGLRIAAYVVNAGAMRIGVEVNKPDAIKALKKAAQGTDIEICPLKVKYPQGGEKQLIKAITGREVPSGKLPMDAGCVVVNVSTAAYLSDALRKGQPITERVITVAGLVNSPCNLRVRVGTDIGTVIAQAGGATPGANKVVLGGPMMGMSAYSLNAPTVKATGGILLMFDESRNNSEPGNCIRCASCVSACPMGLLPLNICALSRKERFEEARTKEHAMDCIECGSCAYVCPAKLPLVQMIRVAKRAKSGK